MNRLSLPGSVWIASDIHLGPQTPLTRQAFHTFLDRAGSQADALILCGDIFDAWIGDDFALSAAPEWLAETLGKFRQVSARIPLWLGHGNRDFLIGTALTGAIGARLLAQPCCLDTDYGPVLLSHGDEYCTADSAYQRFRRFVRHPVVQGVFLSLSLSRRRQIADWARHRSKAANHHKAMSIMDITPAAVEQAFTRSGLGTMVHGHTHRPAVHHTNVDGLARTRIVLPDWDYDDPATAPRGGWLCLDRNGAALNELGAVDQSPGARPAA